MKKTKWLVNLATLVLCVCAIAIGVYAAKRATLTASGTIGFTAHGVDYKVKATIDHYTSDGKSAQQTVSTDLNGETLISGSAEKSLGTMYFSDLVAGGNVITITLEITNLSAFAINCEITPTVTGVDNVTASPETIDSFYIARAGTATQVITLTHSSIDTAGEIKEIDALDISMTLTRHVEEGIKSYLQIVDGTEIEANSATGLDVGSVFVEMGEYNGSAIRWYAFAMDDKNGNMTSFYQITDGDDIDNVGDINYLPAGTYYFISEKCIDAVAFNKTNSGAITDLNYEGSNLQLSITNFADSDTYGETSGNTKIKIKNTDLYKYIIPRNLPGEYIEYEDSLTGPTEGAYDEMLWPLSLEEFTLLKSHGSTIDNSNCETINLLNYENSGVYMGTDWWLRSPLACIEGSASVVVTAEGEHLVNVDQPGFRPAFKLVIE